MVLGQEAPADGALHLSSFSMPPTLFWGFTRAFSLPQGAQDGALWGFMNTFCRLEGPLQGPWGFPGAAPSSSRLPGHLL